MFKEKPSKEGRNSVTVLQIYFISCAIMPLIFQKIICGDALNGQRKNQASRQQL